MGKTVLAVTGISGHTGRLFFKELESKGFDGTVRCLVRNTTNISFVDQSNLPVEIITGNVDNYDDLLKLTHGVDIVMHIYNIHQSVNILKAAIQNNVRRIVLVHTTGVYSKHKSASEEYKLIEKQVDELLNEADIDCTILRPTMIFGDLCDHNIHKFISMVDMLPIMPEINHGKGKINPVNARDLAKMFYTVCTSDHLRETKYDLSGEGSISLHELFEMIGQELGKNVQYISFPMWIGITGSKMLKVMTLGKFDYVEKVLRMCEDRDYGHELATRDLGYQPEQFRIGLKREVNEYLRQKADCHE